MVLNWHAKDVGLLNSNEVDLAEITNREFKPLENSKSKRIFHEKFVSFLMTDRVSKGLIQNKGTHAEVFPAMPFDVQSKRQDGFDGVSWSCKSDCGTIN